MIRALINVLPSVYRNRLRSAWSGFKLEGRIVFGKMSRLLWRRPLPKVKEDKVYLHLGCGNVVHADFINIDTIPAPHIHFVRNIDNLSIFADNSVDLIYASHCLEHFSYRYVPSVLREWFRVLKDSGVLRLSVPDFDLLILMYNKSNRDADIISAPLMGGQDDKYNFHYSIFTERSLSGLLTDAGFREARKWVPGSCGLTSFNDWSGRKIALNGNSFEVSLNLEAIK